LPVGERLSEASAGDQARMGNVRSAPADGLGDAVTTVSQHAREIVRLETELAVAELRRKIEHLKPAGVAAGLASLLGLLGAGMGAAALAALLALLLPWWAALMIVSGAFLVLAAACGAFALAKARAVSPLLPEAAIGEARATVEDLGSRLS
jgi:hypothetical protein